MLNMSQLLQECKRKPSVHVVDKVRYMLLYKAKLEAFREKLPAHRESICAMQELIDCQTPSERRASTVKLRGLVENQEKQQAEDDDEYDRAQKEVVKMFEKRHSSVETGQQLSTSEMLEQLEDDLVAKGVSREEAGQQLLPLTKVLKLQPFTAPLGQIPEIQRPTFKLDVFECACKPATASNQDGDEDRSEVD
jgi:hypothetical protein